MIILPYYVWCLSRAHLVHGNHKLYHNSPTVSDWGDDDFNQPKKSVHPSVRPIRQIAIGPQFSGQGRDYIRLISTRQISSTTPSLQFSRAHGIDDGG